MSEDDFSTVNVKRQQMARELEALRQRYVTHRDTLAKLEADAPSELMAARYAEVRRELESALLKVDDLAAGRIPPVSASTRPAAPSPVAAPAVAAAAQAPSRDWQSRPVLSDAQTAPLDLPDEKQPANRLLLIGAVALAVLVVLGGLAYRFSKRTPAGDKAVIVEQSRTETTAAAPVVETEAPAPAAKTALLVTPDAHDFGTVKKGTRAVRQFHIENHTDKPMVVAIKRSKCHCLWFDFDTKIPARSSTVLAVTLDGAKAKAGALDETIEVNAKGSSSAFEIRAKVE